MSLHLDRRRRPLASFVGILIWVAAARGQQPVRLGLDDCVRLALIHHPRIALAESDIRIREAILDQARAARYRPQLDFSLLGGPVPSATGSPYDPSLRTDWSDFGAFARVELAALQPLYTFGKLEGKADAARSAVDAARFAREQALNEIRRDTERLYCGLLLARDARVIAADAVDRIGKARIKVRSDIETGGGPFTHIDLYRLDMVSGEAEARAITLAATEATLLSGLKAAIGFAQSDDVNVKDVTLGMPARPQVDADSAARDARLARPELQQLRAGDQAMAGLVRSARADAFPQFFAGGLLQYGFAPNRTDQRNPFVWDNYNFVRGGVALGFRYSFNVAATRAKVREVEGERGRLLAQQRAALTSIEVQARTAAQALDAARQRTDVRTKSAALGRRWLMAAEADFSLGVGGTRDLVDAFQAYFQSRVALLEAVHDEYIAQAELDYARGVK